MGLRNGLADSSVFGSCWPSPVRGLRGKFAAARLFANRTEGQSPPNWQVHVSQRGDMLLAFITPPYQEAFDLWYEPVKLRERILGLCPGPDDAIWAQLAPIR